MPIIVDIKNIVTDYEVFLIEVLATFQNLRSVLHWSVGEDGLIHFYVAAATGIGPVEVTPDNLPLVRECLAQVEAAAPGINRAWGVLLFVSQESGKPISYAPAELQTLFNVVLSPTLGEGE